MPFPTPKALFTVSPPELTCPSAPASLDLDLILEESVWAAERNHTSATQIQLVQLVQDSSGHNVAQ